MKQPKLLPGKKRKLTAYEVRKLTRRRHITWQRLGREYNTHFPYEKSGELPGAGDRIVPNAKDLVESYFNEQDEMNNNAIMENEYYDSNNYDKNNEKYNNVNNQTINLIEDENYNDNDNMEEPTSTTMKINNNVHNFSPHSHKIHRAPFVIIQSLWRGAIIRQKVTKALSYEQLKRRATLRRFSKHRMEIERAKAKNIAIFKAAALVQKYIRGFKARKLYREKFSTHFGMYALRIQQLVRSYLSKNERYLRFIARRFESMVLRQNQVVSIQCWYRAMVSYRIYKRLRDAKDQLLFYQQHCLLQATLWTEHILNTAIFKAKAKRKKQLEENIEKFIGFIPIQAHFRGWKQRIAYKQMLIDIEDLKILKWNCAIKIQARWRVRYGKIALKQLKYEKKDEAARLVWMTKAYPEETEDVINDKGKYKINDRTEYTKVTGTIRKSPMKEVERNIIRNLKEKNMSINQSNEHSTFRLYETNEDDFYQWSSSSDNEDSSPRYW